MAKTVLFKVPKQTSSTATYSFPQGFSGGMNISVSPDQLAPNQSPDMSDCNYDDGGIPSKRRGFSKVTATSWGATPIRGMHEFYPIGSSEPIFLVAHGGKLYSYNETTDTKTDLCTGSVTSFTDANVSWFDMGDKCFFFTGQEFLYYDGTNPVGTVQSIAKVPVVALGRKPDGTGGTLNENFNHISQKWRESFDPDGTATVYQCAKQYLDDGITLVTLAAGPFKAYLYGVEKTEGVDFTFNRTTWQATFSTAPGPAGTDVLEIQLEATNLMDPTVITHCTQAIEFGGKNNSVVCATGNPSYPNTVRHTWVYDPTYWPEDYDFNVGGDALPITGWGRMNEYLVTYKRPGDQSVQWYSEIDLDASGNISFSTYQLNDEFGCIAPRTVQPAQNGLLALSDKGVIWTWPSLVKGQANSKVVSRNVNGKNGIASGLLDNTDADLKAAFAIVYRNKYLLHVKDKVWVLDLDYSDLSQGIYCWYPYAGLYASAGAFLTRSDRLYMGDKASGLIYREEPLDEALQYLDDGEAIDDWWQAPNMFLGGRDWVKKFDRIGLTLKAQYTTDHILTLITEEGEEDIVIRQEAGIFSYAVFSYAYHSYGTGNRTYPHTQSEKIGYKGEYISFRIRNNIAKRGMTMLAATIQYTPLKRVK